MAIKEYISKNNYAPVCIVVDFSKYSGKPRLYVYDSVNDVVDYSAQVTHGVGKDYTSILFPKYSNIEGDNLSCVGKFRIGKYRKSRPVKDITVNAYELHGLDPTNSNAYRRHILLHDGIPQFPTFPFPCLPVSKGCFIVNNQAFKELDKVIKCMEEVHHKPVLLYCYNGVEENG